MIQSLTASLRAAENSSVEEGAVWEIRLSSLNHRFFSCKLQLPPFCRSAQAQIQNLIQQRLIRGHIDCEILYRSKTSVPGTDVSALREVCSQVRVIQELARQEGIRLRPPSPLALLQSPTSAPEPGKSSGAHRELTGLLDRACQKLTQIREREGGFLYKELLELLQTYSDLVRDIRGLMDQVPAYYEEQLEQKFRQYENTLRAGIGNSKTMSAEELEGQLRRELAFFLIRGDIREEVRRLEIHAEQAGQTLQESAKSKTPCAKELDFYLQEMNREANTLASKSPLVTIQQKAVQLRVVIEQLREQLRNVL